MLPLQSHLLDILEGFLVLLQGLKAEMEQRDMNNSRSILLRKFEPEATQTAIANSGRVDEVARVSGSAFCHARFI